ncbi:glycosyltransferase family 2 protein [Geotalea toluenoxydans]|uniref:glycosyltransferase family 2 protein n=1 Tax=Geotalea toluenoxydans TaxID=421624 RepID=UPI000A60DC31|nr:glycosyltransferase family 2 protein [Geotalea toluenoxydans]
MKTSVIVPTYNRPRELWLCLLSLAHQSVRPDEVLIADDGSGEATRETIELFRRSSHCPFVLKHIWQEDLGFRKPKILNETVRNTVGSYLAFIDGDCMAHRHWLRNHLRNAEPDAILGGKRVDLGPRLSERLLLIQGWGTGLGLRVLWDSVVGNTRKAEELLIIEATLIRRWGKLDRITDDGIWGCNFSLSKDLFYAINGCDEDFLDGSIEDNDLGIRVLNSGGKVKSVRFMANVTHLWHSSSWSFTSPKYQHNKKIMERRIALKEPCCLNGIVKVEPLQPVSQKAFQTPLRSVSNDL